MIPVFEDPLPYLKACPHTRGDDPDSVRYDYEKEPCPHTRGDDPIMFHGRAISADLSPHAWG